MTDWKTEFPTKEGLYWFYGYRYGKFFDLAKTKKNEPELMFITVHKIKNGFMYVDGSAFMYPGEVEEPHFALAELPELPVME